MSGFVEICEKTLFENRYTHTVRYLAIPLGQRDRACKEFAEVLRTGTRRSQAVRAVTELIAQNADQRVGQRTAHDQLKMIDR